MPFEEVKKVWMNGRMVDFADAKVHAFTHAIHYGSGLFEGIRWGESSVMRETRLRLRRANATWREMPVRWDVDRPEDYRRLLASGLLAEAGK